MRVLSGAVGTFVLLAVATVLAGGDTVAEALAQAGIGGAQAEQIAAKATALGESGVLPIPVINKVREGAAKGVAPGVIAAAALKLAGGMQAAVSLYPGQADPAAKTTAVEAAAKSMGAGASSETLTKVFEALAASNLPRAEWHRSLSVVGSLIAAGSGADRAAAVVTEAIGQGLKPTEISALPARFSAQVRGGKNPGEATDALLGEIKEGKRGEDLSRPDRFDKGRVGEDQGDRDEQSPLRGSGKVKYKGKPGGAPGAGNSGASKPDHESNGRQLK